MNRDELRIFAKIRIREAKILLDKKEYSGAYYLAGYSIECALKASIAKNIKQHEFPDPKMVNKIYSHVIEELIGFAGLKGELKEISKTNSEIAANWSTVTDWKVESRYEIKTKLEATNLYNSIVHENNGILKWIQKYW